MHNVHVTVCMSVHDSTAEARIEEHKGVRLALAMRTGAQVCGEISVPVLVAGRRDSPSHLYYISYFYKFFAFRNGHFFRFAWFPRWDR